VALSTEAKLGAELSFELFLYPLDSSWWYHRAAAASEACGAKKVPSLPPFAIAEELHPCIASCVGQQTPSWEELDSERSRRFHARGMGKGPSSSNDRSRHHNCRKRKENWAAKAHSLYQE